MRVCFHSRTRGSTHAVLYLTRAQKDFRARMSSVKSQDVWLSSTSVFTCNDIFRERIPSERVLGDVDRCRSIRRRRVRSLLESVRTLRGERVRDFPTSNMQALTLSRLL